MKFYRSNRSETSRREASSQREQNQQSRTLLDDLVIYLSGASGDMRG